MYHRAAKNKNGAYSQLICDRYPFAKADITGNDEFRAINGGVSFFATPAGIVVSAEIFNLPYDENNLRRAQIYGFHINNVGKCKDGECSKEAEDEKKINENNKLSEHSGELPPLFGNRGYAWSAVLTDRFSPEDLIGHTLEITKGIDLSSENEKDNPVESIATGLIERA